MTPEQKASLIRLKQSFPFRICFAAMKDGQYEQWAKYDKRKMNAMLRQGWTIVETKVGN